MSTQSVFVLDADTARQQAKRYADRAEALRKDAARAQAKADEFQGFATAIEAGHVITLRSRL